MPFASWVKRSWRLAQSRPPSCPGRRGRRSTKPCLETLENRTAPAVFTVNTRADTPAVNFTTGQDVNGAVSLRAAIQAADNLGGAETILLPAGTYPLTVGDGGSGRSDSAAGQLAVFGSVSLTLTGAGAAATTIDASAINTRVFLIGGGAAAQLSGLTITGGHAVGTGGGIDNVGGVLTLANSVLTRNSATGSAGDTTG